jgi:hypothetical protein
MDKFSFSLIVAIAWSALTGLYGQNTCLPESIVFSTQEQIDNFPANYPGCTVIEGNLLVNSEPDDNITNLDSLFPLTHIWGNLSLASNDSLKSLNGLENLKTIGGQLSLNNNDALIDFNGLASLESIGHLVVVLNDDLQNFSGLENLKSINGAVYVYNNSNLSNTNGLDNLESIGGYLGIKTNPQLTAISGLNQLTSIGDGLIIEHNPSLLSISGLNDLASVNGYLIIRTNKVLETIMGLESLDHSGIDTLIIGANSKLSVCHIQPICDYLENGGGAYFYFNAPGCITQQEVENACLAASVDDLLLKDAIRIFPNPTTGIVQIVIPEHTEWNVRIRDAMGRTMIRLHQLTGGQIDLSNVPAGLYFIELSNGRYSTNRRIVKQ